MFKISFTLINNYIFRNFPPCISYIFFPIQMFILVCNKNLWCSVYLINTNCKRMANTLGSRLKKCLRSTSTPRRFVILLKKDVEEKENSLGLKLKRVLVLLHVYGVLPFSWRKMSKKKQKSWDRDLKKSFPGHCSCHKIWITTKERNSHRADIHTTADMINSKFISENTPDGFLLTCNST